MAKLSAYYGLCPLIDHRSLVGVSEDSNPGHVIVTLGKNIVINYKVVYWKYRYCYSCGIKLRVL